MASHRLTSGIPTVPAFVVAFARKEPRARRKATLPAIESMKREMSATKVDDSKPSQEWCPANNWIAVAMRMIFDPLRSNAGHAVQNLFVPAEANQDAFRHVKSRHSPITVDIGGALRPLLFEAISNISPTDGILSTAV